MKIIQNIQVSLNFDQQIFHVKIFVESILNVL